MSQQVLPLLPADAVPVGPLAGLVETGEGGVVFVNGMATFAFAAADVVGRRLAAVQLVQAKTASVGAVTAAFGVTQVTLWRWREAFAADGVEGLIPAPLGPKGPSKLTDDLAAQIRALDAEGLTLAAIAGQAGVSTATVRVALGRTGSDAQTEQSAAGDETGSDTAQEVLTERDETNDDEAERDDLDRDEQEHAGGDTLAALPVLPAPAPRRGERALARAGLLDEAPVVFTQGCAPAHGGAAADPARVGGDRAAARVRVGVLPAPGRLLWAAPGRLDDAVPGVAARPARPGLPT